MGERARRNRAGAFRTRFRSADLLDASDEVGAFDQPQAELQGFVTSLAGERRSRHEYARVGGRCSRARVPANAPDLVHANLPGRPPLALNDARLAALPKTKVDVAIGRVLAARFFDRPPSRRNSSPTSHSIRPRPAVEDRWSTRAGGDGRAPVPGVSASHPDTTGQDRSHQVGVHEPRY